MNSQNFCFWLKGFLEIGKPNSLNETQVQEIKNHLNLVLNPPDLNSNKTPTYCNVLPYKEQQIC